MRLNWIGYYPCADGYGRFNAYMVRALQRLGIDADPLLTGDIERPDWMLAQKGISWDDLTISCLPPYELAPVPGRHWLYTMTEGSVLPVEWASIIAECKIERVIVPCRANADAFRDGGVIVPIHVVPGGTNPDEFSFHNRIFQDTYAGLDPYTFLTLADRGPRKGWFEVWNAFYKAFGPSTTGIRNVQLMLKCLKDGNEAMTALMRAENRDARIVFQEEDLPSAYDVYAQADCVVLPSRYEGWGMPHREAAMMGLPVITQCHSGLDDGHTHEWAYVVAGKAEAIPVEGAHINGEWYRANVDELAAAMRNCYDDPVEAALKGRRAAAWLRANQTWEHSAQALMQLLGEVGAGEQVSQPLAELVLGG